MKVMVGGALWDGAKTGYLQSIVPLIQEPNVVYAPQNGDALVERARGINATYFLRNTDCDVHLSIDHDIMGFTVADTMKMCELAEEYGIVGATYIGRSREKPNAYTVQYVGEAVTYDTAHRAVEVKWAATGFLAVHRRVFEKLAEGLRLLHARQPWAFYNFYGPFEYEDDEVGEPILLSEDYAFCQRAKEAGFKTYVDPAVRIGHEGKYVYRLEDMAQKPLDPQPLRLTRTAPYSWRIEGFDLKKPEIIVPREVSLNREQRRALARA